MARDELRALADALESEAYLPDTSTKRKAASYLRACADAVPNVSVPAGSRTSQADWHLAALAAPVAQPATDDLPTPAMCRAAVIYANGPDIYKRVPAEVTEIEEGIYAEVWKAMQAAAPVAQPLLDCRTCKHSHPGKHQCMSLLVCTDGDKYAGMPPSMYWTRSKP
jgi:hypothetical protein